MRRSRKKVTDTVFHMNVEFFLIHSSVNEKFLNVVEGKRNKICFYEPGPEKLPVNTRFNILSGSALFANGSFLLFFRKTITHKTKT
jgi:hypothetical protein